jgi:hypothetical protein
MTRYALRTAHGYVSGLFQRPDPEPLRRGDTRVTWPTHPSYASDPDFALTWPTATEALLAGAVLDGVALEFVAVER